MNRPSWVYFATSKRNPEQIKIGFSTRPLGRTSTLKANLLAVVPGSTKSEIALHKRFKHLRLRGEWFSFRAEIKDYISKLPPIEHSQFPAELYLKIPADLYALLVAAADKGHRPISSQVEIYLKRCLKPKAE